MHPTSPTVNDPRFARTPDERALLRMTEALTAAARAAHAEGDDQVSVILYDRSRVCLDRLKEVERILADPARVLSLDPDYVVLASIPLPAGVR